MLESGLHQSACFRPSRPLSPIPSYKIDVDEEHTVYNYEKSNDKTKHSCTAVPKCQNLVTSSFNVSFTRANITSPVKENIDFEKDESIPSDAKSQDDDEDEIIESLNDFNGTLKNLDYDITGDVSIQTNLSLISQLDLSACGTPLPIFTEGYLCLPYLSLPYMDVLLDPNVRGYVLGATNVLFKQKKNLADILIEVESAKIETDDNELKRLLNLSMEDLRFAEYIVKNVCEEKQDLVDGVMWEGGDEWIRMQFKIYLFSLLRTSLLPENAREIDYFNSVFMSAWKDTNNYKAWVCNYGDTISEISPCHPFSGQLSVADMKLKLSHTFQNSEGGKKINQAMLSTGKVVATTGRAVGGAISQARVALSSFWSNVTTVPNNKPVISSFNHNSSSPNDNLNNETEVM